MIAIDHIDQFVLAVASSFCLNTATPREDVRAHLVRENVAVITGPVPRAGAMGRTLSVCIRDPGMNLVEISNDLAV